MANYVLAADTDLSAIPGLSNGWDIDLNGHVLAVSTDMRSVTGLKASGTGTIRLISGGAADFTGFSGLTNPIPETIAIEGGTSASPLPAHRDAANIANNYPLRAAAFLLLGQQTGIFTRIVSHSATNADRAQFATIASATSTTLTFDRDMELEPGDVVGVVYRLSQSTDPNSQLLQVTAYDSQTNTATVATSINPVPNGGAGCVLLTAAFAIGTPTIKPYFMPSSSISGDEFGVVFGGYLNSPSICGHASLKRLVVAASTWPFDNGVFGSGDVDCDVYASNSGCGCYATYGAALTIDAFSYRASFGRAFCPSLFSAFYNYTQSSGKQYRGNTGAGVFVGGGDVSTYPLEPYGRAEFVDCGLPNPLYENIRETTELVIRTTSPETCVIHRAGGIATLVKKGGGDIIMAQAPVANAYQLAPTGTEAVWHDQAVTVEAGARLTVAWRAFCSIGAVGGVQILADSPLFGQVAVPMGAADVLAEYTESSPQPGTWGPSRLLSWRNTSGQPVRVWVRGWGRGGIGYSNAQVVKGGQL